MKVWELMNELSKHPAGKEVSIITPTVNANSLSPTSCDDNDPKDMCASIMIYTKRD